MVYIYVLGLCKGKYYIGKSEQPNVRLTQHISGDGASWTRKYRPISVEKIYEGCDPSDEDKYTLEYMGKHGVENVRGGTFCRVNLTRSQREVLHKMINTAKDQCYHCGKTGHFAGACPHKPRGQRSPYGKNETSYVSDGSDCEYEIVWGCNYCAREFDSEHAVSYHEKKCRHSRLQSHSSYRDEKHHHSRLQSYSSSDESSDESSDWWEGCF